MPGESTGWVDLVFYLFVGTASAYVLRYLLLPRPGPLLKQLAGNRLRIDFVDPPPPATPLGRLWAHLLVRAPPLERRGQNRSGTGNVTRC